MKWLPNLLTVLRMILAVFIAALILRLTAPEPPAATPVVPFLLFCLVALTDFADGWFARRLDAVTKIGALLDPIADKVLVAFCLLALCSAFGWPWMLTIPSFVIISRDIGITILRFVAPVDVPVTRLAKLKTALELIGIGGVLLGIALAGGLQSPQLLDLVAIAWLAIWFAAALSAWTGWLYLKTALTAQDHQ